jgi:hypothetical protein
MSKQQMRLLVLINFLLILLFPTKNFIASSGEENSIIPFKQEKNHWIKIRKNNEDNEILHKDKKFKQVVDNEKSRFFFQQENSDLFEPYVIHPVGSWPEAVAIGDVNGDGRNDVVMTTSFYFDDENDYKLFVFLQDKEGKLNTPVKYDAGDGNSVDIGDLNNDGRNDVVVTASDGIGVFLQNNLGNLAPMIFCNATNDPDKIRIEGLNLDKLMDVVSIGWGGQINGYDVNVFLQNVNGSLNHPNIYTVHHEGRMDLEVGDINQDGLTDIIVMGTQPDTSNAFGVLYQNETGSFDPAVYYDQEEWALAWRLWGIAIGDVNGDTLKDVVVTYGGNQPNSFIGVYLQNAGGTLDNPICYESYDIPEPVVIGDVSGDQRQDVIVAHGGWNALGVYVQDQRGLLIDEELYYIPYASHYNSHGLAIGDINSDWKNDVVIADYNNGLVVLYGTQSPIFSLDITSSEGGKTRPKSGTHTYDAGTKLKIETIPNDGYKFNHWSGDASGSDNSIKITMDSDKSIKANFIRQYKLTINTGEGGTTNPSPGTYIFDPGTEVTIKATPDSGYRFGDWSGDIAYMDNPITVTMNSDMSIKANFIRQYMLTLASGTGGTTDPAPGNYLYDAGTKVDITAKPDTHYGFSYWSGGVAGSANPKTITMNRDKLITANFIRIIYASLDFAGEKVLNRSFSQAEYINFLSWQANPNNVNIAKYRIYLIEGNTPTLVVELNANTFDYWHRGVEKDMRYTYALVAVNGEGREGDWAYVSVQ